MKLSALACLLLYIDEDSQWKEWFGNYTSQSESDDVASSMENCSYYHVVEHLKLEEKKAMFTWVRPVNHRETITNVTLDVSIYAILDVAWNNEFIQWDPDNFCGIKAVAVAMEALWMPDIIIQDMIDKDRSTPSPYLTVFYNGTVAHRNDQVVVSTCRIRVYKFPFDMQKCDLSFRSAMYSEGSIRLTPYGNSTASTQGSLGTLKTQYEWIFINLTITKEKKLYFVQQDVITYTILMKRRCGLYVVNYILPLLFFLCLDFASFLISDMGDKLSFKITVLLAVTVMQLLFNEILPSSSERIPIIAVFCVGIFSLMLLSLLESLVILYLINKDGKAELKQDNPDRRLTDVVNQSDGDVPPNSTLEKAQLLDKFLAALTELLQSKREDGEPGYWTKMAATINRNFIFFYTITTVLFLGIIFHHWIN